MHITGGYEESAEPTGDIMHVIKVNSLRKTAKSCAEELYCIKAKKKKAPVLSCTNPVYTFAWAMMYWY